jgi:phage terminase small subunit
MPRPVGTVGKGSRRPTAQARARKADKKGLSLLQQRFVDEYLIDGNASAAYVRAGYAARAAAGSQACAALKNPKIQAAIRAAEARRRARTEVSQDRIRLEWSRIAFHDVRDAVTVKRGRVNVKDSDQWSDDTAAAVSEITEGADKRISVRFHSKPGALDSLARHLQMFNDRVHLTGDLLPLDTIRSIIKSALAEAQNGKEKAA